MIAFLCSPTETIPAGSALVNSKGKTMGKLICHRADIGLALLRVKERYAICISV